MKCVQSTTSFTFVFQKKAIAKTPFHWMEIRRIKPVFHLATLVARLKLHIPHVCSTTCSTLYKLTVFRAIMKANICSEWTKLRALVIRTAITSRTCFALDKEVFRVGSYKHTIQKQNTYVLVNYRTC